MKNHMKIAMTAGFLLVSSTVILAQKNNDKYKEEAEELRKEVWGWNKPEFSVRSVPAQYANASAVVLARHIEIDAASRKKTNSSGNGMGIHRELSILEITREMVKINDQAALQEYSEFSYTQLKKTANRIIDKTTTVYIGVRVIKPDGQIKEVNADEVVLTKNETREKQAKVAIANLQPGDIIDYFIAVMTSMEQQAIPPYYFVFFDTNPVLHSSIHCEIGKKYAIEYRAYNGAPEFKLTKGEDNSNILEAEAKNTASYPENDLWISPYRQLPIIRMNLLIPSRITRNKDRNAGQVYKDQAPKQFVDDVNDYIGLVKYDLFKSGRTGLAGNTASKHTNAIKKGNLPKDSLAAELYYAYRFDNFLETTAYDNVQRVVAFAANPVGHYEYLVKLNLFLKKHGVENDVVLSSSRLGPSMDGIMGPDDLGKMLLIRGDRPTFYGLEDIFAPAGYLPASYESAKNAIVADTKLPREFTGINFDLSNIDIPVSGAGQNLHLDKLKVKLSADQSTLAVNRQTLLKGHYKYDVQKELILFEDYYEHERKLLGKKNSLMEEFKSRNKTAEYANELQAAFDQARIKQKEAFLEEAKGWLELDISNLENNKVENLGVRHNDPDFIYSSDFSVSGLVKKAGNNLILEVGKLQGSPLRIEEGQKKRQMDVYAPFARTLEYEFQVEIPEGYSVEGINNLNKKVENQCGSFIAEAKQEGSLIKIHLAKVYANSFEKAANWDNLVNIIDAASDWGNTKLLFKKL